MTETQTTAPDAPAGATDGEGAHALTGEIPADAFRGAVSITSAPLARSLLKFGLPLVVAMALQATFNLVDMFIVGGLPDGSRALAALTICDLVAMICSITGNGVANASVAIIARRDGAGNKKGVSMATAQSLTFTIMLSVAFGVAGFVLAEPLVSDLVGAKGVVKDYAVGYMEVIVGGSFSILILLQLVAILRAVGDSKTPMYLLIGSNVLNLLLSILMVYGPDTPENFAWAAPIAEFFGFEHRGVVGAAESTVISRTIAIVLGLVVLARHRSAIRFKLKQLMPDWAEIKLLVQLAWPSSAQFLLRVLLIFFYMVVVTRLFTTDDDATVLTAFGICVRLDTVALFTGMGWGAAASTYVGQNLGAGNRARAYASGWWACLFNAAVMGLTLLIYLTYAEEIIGIFDDTPSVMSAGVEYLKIVGSSYALLGVAIVVSQALSGAGATLSSFIIDAFVVILIQIPVTVFILMSYDVTPVHVWLIIGGGNAAAAIVYAGWYAKKDWMDKEVA